MGTHDAYTRLLGLALRGGNLVTGSDAVQAAAHAGQIRLLMISADASPHVCRDAQTWAERGNCVLIALPCDKAELGGALGRGNVAVAALTDTGLAAAVAERLAQVDPARYADTAARFKRKVERAGERKAAKARARPKEVPTRKSSDAPRRKSNAASNAPKRKSNAASDAPTRKSGVTKKPSAAREKNPGATTRKSNASRTPSATTRKPTASRKPSATRSHDSESGATSRGPNAARGRPRNRAGNPRSHCKDTDT